MTAGRWPVWGVACGTLMLLGSLPNLGWAASAASIAGLKRDSARCVANPSIDGCMDVIRRSPNDPALLIALGTAEVRAGRTENALRHYRRAAELAPATRGLSAKIAATEARLHPKRSAAVAKRVVPALTPAPAPVPAPVPAPASLSAIKPAAKQARSLPPPPATAAATADVPESSDKRYSNAAPQSESH